MKQTEASKRVRLARMRMDQGAALAKADVAALVGVTTRTVDTWMKAGRWPRPDLVFSSRCKKWSPASVRRQLAGGAS